MKSVLVIDDEPAIRKALQRALVSAGHPVQLANNGTEGFEALKAQTADIVIERDGTRRGYPGARPAVPDSQ